MQAVRSSYFFSLSCCTKLWLPPCACNHWTEDKGQKVPTSSVFHEFCMQVADVTELEEKMAVCFFPPCSCTPPETWEARIWWFIFAFGEGFLKQECLFIRLFVDMRNLTCVLKRGCDITIRGADHADNID
ncbi:hypothetical protein F4778DRAFT_650820 [Xylariomycetidae sp. FL2044]|nr:hypothetical protein F4778DRAFT_650820 [Xylariomycetidae sp. FL2044]